MQKLMHFNVAEFKCVLIIMIRCFRFWPNNKSRMYILEAAGMLQCEIWIQLQIICGLLGVQTLIA
jgi:hypothetical protein